MKIKHLFLIIATALFAVSCSSDDDTPDYAAQIKGEYTGSIKISVDGTEQGSFENQILKVSRVKEDSVVVVIENIRFGNHSIEKITAGSKVAYKNGKYILSGGSTKTTSGSVTIVATVSSGEIENGIAKAMIKFTSGSMPTAILDFTGDISGGEVKEIKQLNATEYTHWHYVNLETGKIVSHAIENKVDESSFDWHIAFHRFEIKTNGGEAIALKGTTLSDITTIPANGFTADVEKDIMPAFVMPPTFIKSNVNEVLEKWVIKTATGSMPPYIYEVDKEKIFIVKDKKGNYAKIKFTDHSNDSDKSPYISFYYKYPVK